MGSWVHYGGIIDNSSHYCNKKTKDHILNDRLGIIFKFGSQDERDDGSGYTGYNIYMDAKNRHHIICIEPVGEHTGCNSGN